MTVYSVGNFQLMFELALLPRRMDLRQPLESGPVMLSLLNPIFHYVFTKEVKMSYKICIPILYFYWKYFSNSL